MQRSKLAIGTAQFGLNYGIENENEVNLQEIPKKTIISRRKLC